jgi:hypothetical protein
MNNILDKVTDKKGILAKIATISVTMIAIVNLVTFYKNNIQKPKVEIIDTDYKKGVANLKINGREFTLRGDSSYLIEGDWGIRFGTTFDKTANTNYNRIELLKRGMVYKIIS